MRWADQSPGPQPQQVIPHMAGGGPGSHYWVSVQHSTSVPVSMYRCTLSVTAQCPGLGSGLGKASAYCFGVRVEDLGRWSAHQITLHCLFVLILSAKTRVVITLSLRPINSVLIVTNSINNRVIKVFVTELQGRRCVTPGEKRRPWWYWLGLSVDIILHSSPLSPDIWYQTMGARVRSQVYVSITTSSIGVIIWVNYGQNPLDCGKSLFLPELW